MFRFWRRFRSRYRCIFKFDTGTGLRRIDPLIVCQRLSLDPDYIPQHLADAESGEPIPQAIVAAAACRAFHVTPYDDLNETGLTTAERIDLMISFDNYLLALKKSIRPSPTLPQPTGAIHGGSSGPTTNGSSDFGQTATGKQSATPSQFGLGPSPH